MKNDKKLANIAREHSADMVNRKYFDHDTPEGFGPSDRAKNVGYSGVKHYGSYYTDGISENISSHPSYHQKTIRGYDFFSHESLAERTVYHWMNSPGHRDNILDKNYDRLGVGVAILYNPHNLFPLEIYSTQNFCLIKP